MQTSVVWQVFEENNKHIFIGCSDAGNSRQLLMSKNIRTVVSLDERVVNQQPNCSYHFRLIGQFNILEYLEECGRWIAEGLTIGSVLVVCRNGISMSPTVVIAYLMNYQKWKYEAAFYYLKQKNNCINPSVQMKKWLIIYQKHLQQDVVTIQLQELVVEHKFSDKVRAMQQKGDLYEDSPQRLLILDTQQQYTGDQTPMFESPMNQMMCSRKNSTRRGSLQNTLMFNKQNSGNRDLLDYSFHNEDMIDEVVHDFAESPKFGDKIKKRQRRHRCHYRISRSVHSQME